MKTLSTISAIIATMLLTGCQSFIDGWNGVPLNSSVAASPGTYSLQPRKIDFQIVETTNFFNQIPWVSLKKTEFETEDQFHKRISSLSFGGPVFVEMPAAKHIYDAEKQTLFFAVEPEYGKPGTFTVALVSKEYGHDIEQNSYGAKVDVTHVCLDDFRFKCLNFNQIPAQVRPYVVGQSDSLGFLIPMPSDLAKARVESDSLSLVARAEIRQLEYAKEEINTESATVSNPKSYLFISHELPVQISGVFLIDRSTGVVLASWLSSEPATNP